MIVCTLYFGVSLTLCLVQFLGILHSLIGTCKQLHIMSCPPAIIVELYDCVMILYDIVYDIVVIVYDCVSYDCVLYCVLWCISNTVSGTPGVHNESALKREGV